MSRDRSLLVDIHTHVYTPTYVDLLRSRTSVPRVTGDKEKGNERLLILPDEPENVGGRPLGKQYWDRQEKIDFMDRHGIDISIVSLANPWLDFLSTTEAASVAGKINADLESYCSSLPQSEPSPSSSKIAFTPQTGKRLYFFGVIPLVHESPTAHNSSSSISSTPDLQPILDSISRLNDHPHLRGIILGTRGLGFGLDDPRLEPIWAALEKWGGVIFVHPHYGVGALEDAGSNNGHVVPLALGFPFETTTAVARLILSGVLDRHPGLKFLLAHSAGALPALSSRLASCVAHDPVVKDILENDVRWYLGRFYYDAVCYGPEELAFLERAISRSRGYEGQDETLAFVDRVRDRKDMEQIGGSFPGTDRIFFGTDHPFFPPLDNERIWRSVGENLGAIESVPGWQAEDVERVKGQNAVDIFELDV